MFGNLTLVTSKTKFFLNDNFKTQEQVSIKMVYTQVTFD